MRAWLGAVASVALIGCARPIAVSQSVPPGLSAGASDFAIEASNDPTTRAAVPVVVHRLESYGFRQSGKPNLLVVVSASQRPRSVGAFSPAACSTDQWVVDPNQKWLVGGEQATMLQVLIVDARSGQTLYRSQAYRRTSTGAPDVAGLAAAALSTNPRLAAPAAGSRCP